ncbi:MAG: GerW family sporulation protein [Lachnospiraceae bacterium]|nr:GerW family sporulation protein [Lachnospiraceae bacterium]
MADKGFNDVVNSLLTGMDGFLSSKTVVGEPVKIGETIIVPFVDVSFGVGAGSFRGEKKDNGAGGLTGKITPSAVLVIANGTTRIVNIKNQDGLTKILDMVPDVVNNIAARKNKKINDEDAVDAAFPERSEKPEEPEEKKI